MAISRQVNKFSDLYYMVKIENPNGNWNNIEGQLPAQTNVFRITTINNSSYYGIAPNSVSAVDWGLDIGSVDNSFGGIISKDPLAKIPKVSFSIDNLELIYHRLSDANGGDLNVFYGADVTIYLCNGYVDGMFWNSSLGQWVDEDGQVYADQISAPIASYPDDDFSYRIFTGTVNNITFSPTRTNFSALGVSDKINNVFGTLAGVDSDFKTRGQIIPITYGNWAQNGDLAPLVLERDSSDVPRVFLDTQPLEQVNTLRLYDKVSELDYRVSNQRTVNNDNNILTFQSDEAAANLQKNITSESDDWDNGSEFTNEINTYFPTTDGQKLYQLDGETVAFHTWWKPFKNGNRVSPSDSANNRAASRGWKNSELESHISTSELYEIEKNIQKAIAIVDIPLVPEDLAYEENYLPVEGLPGGPFPEQQGTQLATGSLENTLKNEDSALEDSLNSSNFFKVGVDSIDIEEADSLIKRNSSIFRLNFQDFGFTGEVLRFDVDFSFLGYRSQNYSFDAYYDNFVKIFNVDDFTILLEQRFNRDWVDPNETFDFRNFGADLATQYDTTDKIKQGMRILLQTFVNRYNDSVSPTTGDEFPAYLQWNYFNATARIKVFAENGLWYWRGLGRTNGSLIESPSSVFSDILEKELNFTNFIDNTTERSDWKNGLSLYGKEPQWRQFAKEFCLNNGIASFSDYLGNEVIFDLEAKDNPDRILNLNQVELKNELQEINYSFSDRSDLYNEFIIKFRKNPANNQFLNILSINEDLIQSTEELEFFTNDAPNLRNRCALSSGYLGLNNGEKKQFIFEANHIRNQRTAEQLLQHFVRWHTSTKAIVKVNTILPETYDWELGEQVEFGNSVNGIPMKVKNARYIITGKSINPNIKGSSPSISFTFMEIPS